MEKCNNQLHCERFKKYSNIENGRDRGLFSSDVGMRTKAFLHLSTYCNGMKHYECPERLSAEKDFE